MARYRTTDVASGQGLFMTINLSDQLIPGTFEHMLNLIIGTIIDISIFDRKYKNDDVGASAVPPSVLLKLIIYAYSKGCYSSRKIMELNNNNVVAKALTGDMDIHFTTIADFISSNNEEFKEIFVKVLAFCNELELIGGETYAVDGLRLPSNASMEMSGTGEQLQKRVETYKKMAEKHIARHQKKDAQGETDKESVERFEKRQKQLNDKMNKISNFLAGMEKKEGRGGQEIQSNVTDNDSAIIHSSKGFIQGYIGIAVTDEKSQIITSAQAVGDANETEYFPEILDKNQENLDVAGVKTKDEQTFLGDANYFSEDNLGACAERGVEGIIPDSQAKRRFNAAGDKRFDVSDFKYDEEENCYKCPQGKCLEFKRVIEQKGVEGAVYQASLSDCRVCPDFSRCSWSKKEQSEIKQGKSLIITKSNSQNSLCTKMREKMSTEEYQDKYSRRIGIVEPVFSNIGYCKGLNRFTLRGKEKVNGQWLLYCIVHNLGKCNNVYDGWKKSA
jgi:transposase